MSAKPCNRCGGVIVFGKDRETGQIIPLSVGGKVYKIIKDNIVMLDPKAMIRHVCITERQTEPSPAQDFNEPKESELDI